MTEFYLNTANSYEYKQMTGVLFTRVTAVFLVS